MVVLAFALALLLLAGCGTDGEEQPAAPPDHGTHLEVVVMPEGPDGPERRKTVTETDLRAKDFAPTDPMTACTEIYGGPATATVKGTLGGEEIDASFSRENGCEIGRWERVESLLGRVPGPQPPPP